MGHAALLYTDDRADERWAMRLDGTVRSDDALPHDVIIDDFSLSGCRLRTDLDLAAGQRISVGIAGLGIRHLIVVRATAHGFGCAFLQRLALAELRALRTPDVIAFPTTVSVEKTQVSDDENISSPRLRRSWERLAHRLRAPILGLGVMAPWLGLGVLLYR